MRRKRHRETRVWHDPLTNQGRRGGQSAKQQARAEEDRPKRRKVEPTRRRSARIIAGPTTLPDADEIERQRLLDRLLAAEGRALITATTDDYLNAGHELPCTQKVLLQVLEHKDEERVADAIGQYATLLTEEEPQRRAVLESRLRRIEEYADEVATQKAASALRRQLGQRVQGVAPEQGEASGQGEASEQSEASGQGEASGQSEAPGQSVVPGQSVAPGQSEAPDSD